MGMKPHAFFFKTLPAVWITVMMVAGVSAYAGVHVTIQPPNIEVIPLENPRVDFAMRIEAINRAKYTIEMATYLSTVDPGLGLQIISALKAAAARGVVVYYMDEWLPNLAFMGLKADAASEMLKKAVSTNPDCPSEVLCIKPMDKILYGVLPNDTFHEKTFIVDGGTPHELAWLGGRNNNDFAMNDYDYAVLLRRMDRNKRSAIDTIRKVAKTAWTLAAEMQTPAKLKYLPKNKVPASAKRVISPEKSILAGHLDLIQSFRDLRALIFEGSKREKIHRFRPAKITVTTNDFFQQLKAADKGFSSMEQRGFLDNDNINFVVQKIKRAKSVYLTSMAIVLPEKLMEALKEAIDRGAVITLLTNSSESEAVHVPGGIGSQYGMRDIHELMDYSVGKSGELFVMVLDPEKVASDPRYSQWVTYMHRKVLVTDRTVVVGSENYNIASTQKNSEMAVHFDDVEFASYFKQSLDSDLTVFRQLDCKEVLQGVKESYVWYNRVRIRMIKPFM